jgi:cellulose synthase/poly-beta-1,6-N-acetylglucosamine synthase-like glycosyltransferase
MVSSGLCALFLAAMACRLLLCANRFRLVAPPEPADAVADKDLPVYSVLVPLHDEANMARQIVARLDAIDYPAVKLEIKLIVEEHDVATRVALLALPLSPVYEIVTAPPGDPRTKPRALNIALALIKGDYVTIYDAEDTPDPDQLRKAVARFAALPRDVACLQASLAIAPASRQANRVDHVLARLFAIEYAALFDLYNVGVGLARMPMALGGTSNHIRTRVLRDVGGWDAWNVAEDADLGVRLARFGYRAEALDSTTLEQAPRGLGGWFKQRRRWTKGWLQTILVLATSPLSAMRDLGPARTAIVILMAVSLIVGPVLSPVLALLIGLDLWTHGIPRPQGVPGVLIATLWGSVFVMGLVAPLWMGYAGIRLRRLEAFLPMLPLVLPYQIMIAAAAVAGLVDLLRDPYHWHKTRHYADGEDDP